MNFDIRFNDEHSQSMSHNCLILLSQAPTSSPSASPLPDKVPPADEVSVIS